MRTEEFFSQGNYQNICLWIIARITCTELYSRCWNWKREVHYKENINQRATRHAATSIINLNLTVSARTKFWGSVLVVQKTHTESREDFFTYWALQYFVCEVPSRLKRFRCSFPGIPDSLKNEKSKIFKWSEVLATQKIHRWRQLSCNQNFRALCWAF